MFNNIYSGKKWVYSLLCFIFGGGMASRLFQKVREEHGLVYSISCIPELYECGGDVVISLGTNKKNQNEAMRLVKEEIDKLVEEGFTEEELLRNEKIMEGFSQIMGVTNVISESEEELTHPDIL